MTDRLQEFEEAMQFLGRFDSLRAAGGVKRFHTHHTVVTDTVAAHSWGVACLVDLLYAGRAPAHMLRAAMYHDSAEGEYGDIPSPTKRLLNSEALRTMEDQWMRERGLFVTLSPFERHVIKLADVLDGLTFCAEETQRGNRTLIPIWNKYYQYLQEKFAAMDRENYAESEGELFTQVMKAVGQVFGVIQAKMETSNAIQR